MWLLPPITAEAFLFFGGEEGAKELQGKNWQGPHFDLVNQAHRNRLFWPFFCHHHHTTCRRYLLVVHCAYVSWAGPHSRYGPPNLGMLEENRTVLGTVQLLPLLSHFSGRYS